MKIATRKAITAGTTFSVALSIGFAMQYGDAVASRIGVDEPIGGPSTQIDISGVNAASLSPFAAPARPPVDQIAMAPIPQEIAVPTMQVPDVRLTKADAADKPMAATAAEEKPIRVAATSKAAPGTDAMIDTPTLMQPMVASCAPVMTATVQPLAMVKLKLADVCHISTPVTIHHQGMMFSLITDETGTVEVDVPALARDALFIADFKTGKGAAASVMVPDLDGIDRAVLQWQGEDGVQLHALEFGAGYDDAGHVWSASTGDLSAAETGQGGFLKTLGDAGVNEALLAEVYTYPTGQSARDGQIVLNVEAEITSRNCGRDVAAQSIQIGPDHPASAIDLTMTMPGCDAIGEFLVLKNMFADLTLAAK